MPLTAYAVTYGGPSLLMTAVFWVVLPLVYFKWLRHRVGRWWLRLLALLAIWGGAFVLAYGELLWNAQLAQQLCEREGGLHAKTTATAAGFIAPVDFEHWEAKGFRYVEFAVGSEKRRTSRVVGVALTQRVEAFMSDYEVVTRNEVVTRAILRQRTQLIDHRAATVLGEFVAFRLYPSWIDRALLARFGGGPLTAPRCAGPGITPSSRFPNATELLIDATLQPPPNGAFDPATAALPGTVRGDITRR
ncbi:MAG: hypothetical protein EXR83_09035 [Gammaproteobacteria bacterium]|nr:hypothetical protein [Gammaproteobacteria bacterium]